MFLEYSGVLMLFCVVLSAVKARNVQSGKNEKKCKQRTCLWSKLIVFCTVFNQKFQTSILTGLSLLLILYSDRLIPKGFRHPPHHQGSFFLLVSLPGGWCGGGGGGGGRSGGLAGEGGRGDWRGGGGWLGGLAEERYKSIKATTMKLGGYMIRRKLFALSNQNQ